MSTPIATVPTGLFSLPPVGPGCDQLPAIRRHGMAPPRIPCPAGRGNLRHGRADRGTLPKSRRLQAAEPNRFPR